MHYCLSSQVDKEYLKKADEVRLKYNELNKLLDIYEDNPNITFIIRITSKEDKNKIQWQQLEQYNIMTQNKVIIETDSFQIMDVCKLFNLQYFYAIPVNTLYEVKALKDYGCCDVRIDAPLTHMLDKLGQYGMTVRMTPNIAYYKYIPREDGVIGSWVRPEDVELYEPYVEVFEFEDCDRVREQALYNTYAIHKKWPGSVNNLISNLDYQGTNRLIPRDFTELRLMCGQKCLSGHPCKACYTFLDIADPEKIQSYLDKIGQNNQNKN